MILLSHKLYTVVKEYLDLIDSFPLLLASQESQAGLIYFKGTVGQSVLRVGCLQLVVLRQEMGSVVRKSAG